MQLPSATSAASGPTRILISMPVASFQIKKQGRTKNQALARLGASFEIRKNDVDPGAMLVPVIFVCATARRS